MSEAPSEVLRGSGALVVVTVPPRWLALEVDDTDNNPRTAERPELASEVWRRIPEAMVLVDGPMFEVADHRPYATSQQSRLLYRYLDTRRRVDVPSSYPDRGATLSVDGEGHASVIRGAGELRGAVFAVQGFPELLRDGENVQNPERDRDNVKRAALALFSDGRVGFAIGRAPMHAFTDAMREIRASNGARITAAVYTDGGDSMALALRGPGGSDLVAENMNGRRLPVYVLAIPRASGAGMVAPGWGAAWAPVVAALAGTGALVALVRAWLRSRRVVT